MTVRVFSQFFSRIVYPATNIMIVSTNVMQTLSSAISSFLDTLPAEARVMFILRYWSCLSVQEIAAECGGTDSKVKMTLLRTRNKLREYLEQEGYL